MNSQLTTILESTFGNAYNYNDLHYHISRDQDITNYMVLPIPFIKIISKYLDEFISNNNHYRLIKNIRNRYRIKVKFNLTKFQTSRIFLENIFKKSNTDQLDLLYEQLKLYGNYVLDMNIKYDEIIKYIHDCTEKNNHYLELQLIELNKKLERMKRLEYDVEKLELITLKKIEIENNIQHFDLEDMERNIYIMFNQYIESKINKEKQDIVREKVTNYITNMTLDSSFRNINDYSKNNGSSLGISYENTIFENLKGILNQHGFEIIKNVEMTFEMDFSGIKLEYDFIIGKIVDQTFIVYAVLDAKISKALIRKDIDKFVMSIEYLKQNKLTLRKRYHFNQIIHVPDDKIIMGYFYQTGINTKKEISKAISTYLINNGNKTLELLENCYINFEVDMLENICSDITIDNNEFIETLKAHQTCMFNVN
jgi:hypothetical protein